MTSILILIAFWLGGFVVLAVQRVETSDGDDRLLAQGVIQAMAWPWHTIRLCLTRSK